MEGKISILDAALAAVAGYSVVFLGLAILMVMVTLLGRFMQRKKLPAEAVAVIPAAPAQQPAAPAGGIQVDDRTAALLMAIVADKLGESPDRLRFVSIREIKEEENHAV